MHKFLTLAAIIGLSLTAPSASVAHEHGHTGHDKKVHDHDHGYNHSTDDVVASDTVSIAKAYAFETHENAKAAAVFMHIDVPENHTSDEIISASSDVTERVELHTHLHEDGVMRMRSVETFKFAGEDHFNLEPSGDHIMLIGLKSPLKGGESFPLTLNFKSHDPVTVNVIVKSLSK